MWQRLKVSSQPAIRSDDIRLTAWSWVFRGPVVLFEGGYGMDRMSSKISAHNTVGRLRMLPKSVAGLGVERCIKRPDSCLLQSRCCYYSRLKGGEQYGPCVLVDGCACHSAWTRACKLHLEDSRERDISRRCYWDRPLLCFFWPHRHNGMA